ncbi:MAG: histidine phosphatase family protein [Bryobacteraceae bacterium]|nr:histidine phosphatase family protein [Bryobacteraceae bacterium]
MPTLTLIRHGQAGTRDNYDVLSETGVAQARLLGLWLDQRVPAFDAVFSGSLERQRQTAAIAMNGGLEVRENPDWNEFDMDGVFEAIVPLLSEADAGFRERYGLIQTEIAGGGESIHREWKPADGEVMVAWLKNRFGEMAGVESWEAFRQRVRRALQSVAGMDEGARVCVFTSALPAALCIAEALGLEQPQILSLAGTSYNTGITVLRIVSGRPELVSFNSASHLPEQLLTHR